MGATDVFDPTVDDVTGVTKEITEVGADYAFECAGVASLAAEGIEATRAGGTTVLVGAPRARREARHRPARALRHRREEAHGLLPR